MASSYTSHRPDLAPPDRLHVGGQEREIEIAPDVPMRFCWCPPGEFLMGSPESEADRRDNETLHLVQFTHGFWLAKHQVTQRQWQAVMGYNPSEKGKGEDIPVDSVSWEDCENMGGKASFCDKLGLHLPTEAQWEYACRAGHQRAIGIGGGTYLNAQMANFNGGHPYGDAPNAFSWAYRHTALPAGCFPPNAWGLHDMHGQLWEWCHDWRSDRHVKSDTPDSLGTSEGVVRVLRGGSWFDFGGNARSAIRFGFGHDGRSFIGLRPSSNRLAPEAKSAAQPGTSKA